MLPMPATSADPAARALIEVLRLRVSAEQTIAGEVFVERLGTEPGGEVFVDGGSATSMISAVPKRRGSVKASAAPLSSSSAPRRWADGVADGLAQVQQIAGHPQVHDQRRAVVEREVRSTCRGARGVDARPVRRFENPRGEAGATQRGSVTTTFVIIRPSSIGASCRRIVSTSGSSGTRGSYARCARGRSGGEAGRCVQDAAAERFANSRILQRELQTPRSRRCARRR